MVGLLFQREVLPTLIIANPAGYKIELTKDYPVRESWMGIYFKDKKIGFSNTIVSHDIDKGIAGYRINEMAVLRFSMLGEQQLVRIRGSSFFNEDYRLKNFSYKLVSGGHKLDISGYSEGENLNITVDPGTGRKGKIIKIDPDTLISNSINPILLFKKLEKNRDISFEVFDPVTFGTSRANIRNVGSEDIEFGKKSYHAYIFETDISGIKTKTWMTDNGDILKEESILGFTMHKESPDQAFNFSDTFSFSAQDLVSEFSLPSNIAILKPGDVRYLRIKKDASFEEIFKDKEPLEGNALTIPIQDIPEEEFVQSKDERIITLARQIVGSEKNSWIASKMILHWVYDNLEKRPTLSVPDSLSVLNTMQGDCNEHTVLFTALTRSIGIPTKMVAGLVYLNNAFYYHAWPRVYVGEWINMDPTLGQEIADATHIPLLEGGLKEQLNLVNIIGTLKIEILEYK